MKKFNQNPLASKKKNIASRFENKPKNINNKKSVSHERPKEIEKVSSSEFSDHS